MCLAAYSSGAKGFIRVPTRRQYRPGWAASWAVTRRQRFSVSWKSASMSPMQGVPHR